MGIYTSIEALDANDDNYKRDIAALAAGEITDDEKWEVFGGDPADRPGGVISTEDAVTETDDEYGGWVVDLSKLPENATHILVTRG